MIRLREWLGGYLGAHRPVRRWVVLVLTCLACALLLTDYAGPPDLEVLPGEVAERDVIAPLTFRFVDDEATAAQQAAAEAQVAPVFEANLNAARLVENRVAQAFDMARRRHETAVGSGPAAVAALTADFIAALDLGLDPAELEGVTEAGFPAAVEEAALEMIAVAFRRPIIADRVELPHPPRTITVVSRIGDLREETTLDDFSQVRVPEEARHAVSLHFVERFQGARNATEIKAAAAIARAAVRPTFSYAAETTAARRKAARDTVGVVEVQVRKGTRLLRGGDVITAQQIAMLGQLRTAYGPAGGRFLLVTWLAFSAVLIVSTVAFARATIRKFSWRTRDLEAMALALLSVLAIGRVTSELSASFAGTDGVAILALALLAPVSGGAMVVRILVNSESALVWSLVAGLLVAVQQDQSALLAAYYIVTALAAASGTGQARERLAVLKSGLQSGLVGAGLVLLLVLVRSQAASAESPLPDLGGVFLLWGAALGAGVVGAFFVLGVIPAFELVGFTTDYKLLELANLNHPLLRQLMLRAPGTYHHSVIVGSLSEAACEVIGANALLARVACYFHDVGKGLKPQYFIENQREAGNRHDRLTPAQSAAVIINHVRDGAALAVQYRIPKAVADHIFMHHGTGIIAWFYAKAKEQAGEGEEVDEAPFRYPGPKPDTREAGVIMLADKVEAACRTIRDPSEARIRAMIQQIINSVMNDGQLERCPITLKELYEVADSFTTVLLGIYHHRIEYPATASISSGRGKFIPVPKQGTITLEIVNPITRPGPMGAVDYESAEQLPTTRTATLPTDDS